MSWLNTGPIGTKLGEVFPRLTKAPYKKQFFEIAFRFQGKGGRNLNSILWAEHREK